MPDPERVLSQRELNRALLARQFLLERGSGSIPRALDSIGGIQAQYAPSMYVGLWSRLEGFKREQLTRALTRRSVVQGTLQRVTIHLVSAGDYWLTAVAIRDWRRRQWLQARSTRAGSPNSSQLSALARRLRRKLADGPLTRRELDELHGRGSTWTNGANVALDLVRIPPSGTWERRRADIFASAEEWLGPQPPELTAAEGVELLVKRYLSGFGPAQTKDIANWAGLPPKQVDPVVEGMRLRHFVDEDGEELVDLPRGQLPAADTPAPVRLLPVWDATLLAHARRTCILPEQHRPKVFNVKTPQSVNTFLVDGVVAGTWRFEKGRVLTEPFGKLDRGARAELRAEAERLAAFHA